MLFLLRYSVSHPRSVVALAGALTLAATFFIRDVDLRLDGRSLIPSDDPSMEASDAAAARFHLGDTIVLGVLAPPQGICTPAGLDLVVRLSAALGRVEGVEAASVASVATLPRLVIEGDTLDLRPLVESGPGVDAATASRVCKEVEAFGFDDGVVVSPALDAAAIHARLSPPADRRLVNGQEGGGLRVSEGLELARRARECVPGLPHHCPGRRFEGQVVEDRLAHLALLDHSYEVVVCVDDDRRGRVQ